GTSTNIWSPATAGSWAGSRQPPTRSRHGLSSRSASSCSAAEDLLLRPEGDDGRGVGLEIGAFDQVDAIGDRRHHRIEAFADGTWAARQVHDQRLAADAGRLPGEDGGGDLRQ